MSKNLSGEKAALEINRNCSAEEEPMIIDFVQVAKIWRLSKERKVGSDEPSLQHTPFPVNSYRSYI